MCENERAFIHDINLEKVRNQNVKHSATKQLKGQVLLVLMTLALLAEVCHFLPVLIVNSS